MILEAVIGAMILAITIGGLAILYTRQWALNADTDVLGRVENAVSQDLGWQKTYAKYWMMSSGPYNLTATQTGASAYVVSTNTIEYEPDSTRCATATGLAGDFVTAASSVTITPARPFPIAVGRTQLAVSGLPSTISLWRTISLGKNIVFVSYSLEGDGAASYRFQREVALRPEASAWC